MPTEGYFLPVTLTQKPTCELTEQWSREESGAKTIRYVGADGYLYDFVKPNQGKAVWKRIGKSLD